MKSRQYWWKLCKFDDINIVGEVIWYNFNWICLITWWANVPPTKISPIRLQGSHSLLIPSIPHSKIRRSHFSIFPMMQQTVFTWMEFPTMPLSVRLAVIVNLFRCLSPLPWISMHTVNKEVNFEWSWIFIMLCRFLKCTPIHHSIEYFTRLSFR